MHVGRYYQERTPALQQKSTLTAQSWDRVKGTKRTRVMERIRVSPGAIFSTTVSCCGTSMDPSGMTSRRIPERLFEADASSLTINDNRMSDDRERAKPLSKLFTIMSRI